MKKYEINGNLDNEKYGLKNYEAFEKTIADVWEYFETHLGSEALVGPELYIDNGTTDTGYTPITTPVWKKYVIIKLGIKPNSRESQIAFQFSHELMHYVYFVKYGLNKNRADYKEEAVCTAASLCVLFDLFPNDLDNYINSLCQEEYKGYRLGIEVANKINYDFSRLIAEGEDVCKKI